MTTRATTRAATIRATTGAVTRTTRCCAGLALALALVVPGIAHASDASLRNALGTWSHRIGLEARDIGLSAANRHPRRLTARALHFRTDALRAGRALASVSPSSARGRRAKKLAVAAFREYALVGRVWALVGRARTAHHDTAAAKDARVAVTHAEKANGLLLSADRLLS